MRVRYFILSVLVFAALTLSAKAGLESNTPSGQKQEVFEQLVSKINSEQEKMPRQALMDSRLAINIARNSNHDEWLQQAYLETSEVFFRLGHLDSCYHYTQLALELNVDNDSTRARLYNRMIVLERDFGNFEKAVQYGENALVLFRKEGDSAGVAETMLNMSNIYRYLGKFDQAMTNLFAALNVFEQQKDSCDISRTMGNIANLYMDIDDRTNAKEYFLKAIRHASSLGYDTRYGDALNNYGALVYDEQKYDSAYFYFDSARRIYEKTGQLDAMATAYENTGIALVYLNQKQKGLKNLHRSYAMFDSLGLKEDRVNVLLDLGLAFEKTGNNDSVFYYYSKSYAQSGAIGFNYGKKQSLRKLYLCAKKENNFKNALTWYEQYTRFKDSIEGENLKKNLQEMEVKYQTVKKEKTILELKDRELIEKSNRRFLLLLLIIVVTLVFFLALFFWFKRKKDMQIHQQKMLALKHEKALVETEMAKKELEAEKLQKDIEYKTRQLAGHALNMMQKNKLLQSISTDIETKMKSPDCGDKQTMKQILRSVQQGLNIDKDWDLFKIYFEQINERFFDKLKEINPALTGNDYRLCALTKLNLSIKEMASVLNISPDSLKNARYRLKKKLKLSPDDNLNTFLNNL